MSWTPDEMMAVEAARRLHDWDVCFVGIGLPSLAANLARATHQFARDWDPLDAQVWFDHSDESFFWSEEYGTAHFWPAPGLQMVQFLMPVQNAAGERVSIEGSITFARSIEL